MTGNLQTFGQVGPVSSLRVGLIVCINFRISARIPLPALRATLSPGEGIGKAEISCAIVRFSAVY